jgi:phage-related protein
MVQTLSMYGLRPIPLSFWRSAAGKEPVREFLVELDKADRRKVGADIRTVQYGWPVGMPLVRSLAGGLWELRTSLPSAREARVFFTVAGEEMFLLHAIIKKSQKTPDHELALAKRRLKELKK